MDEGQTRPSHLTAVPPRAPKKQQEDAALTSEQRRLGRTKRRNWKEAELPLHVCHGLRAPLSCQEGAGQRVKVADAVGGCRR